MTADVLAVDAGELRRTAVALRGVVAELERAFTTLSQPVSHGRWEGLASLEQAARRAETATLLRALGTPVEVVARGLDEVAAMSDDAGGRVRRHTWTAGELQHERDRLVATGTPADPVLAHQWQARVGFLEDERVRLVHLADRARGEFDETQRVVAARIDHELRTEVFALLGSVALAVETARRATSGWRGLQSASSMAVAVHRLRRMPVPGGERTLYLVAQRADRAADLLRKRPPGWLLRIPTVGRHIGAAAARGAPLMVLVSALPTLADGGGYAGARGRATRVLAGAAVVGVVAAAVLSAPVAVPAGLAAAGTYQAWMAGNWVYDNRHRLGSAALRTWSGTRQLLGRGVSGGRAVVERAEDRARSGLDRLRRRWTSVADGSTAAVLP